MPDKEMDLYLKIYPSRSLSSDVLILFSGQEISKFTTRYVSNGNDSWKSIVEISLTTDSENVIEKMRSIGSYGNLAGRGRTISAELILFSNSDGETICLKYSGLIDDYQIKVESSIEDTTHHLHGPLSTQNQDCIYTIDLSFHDEGIKQCSASDMIKIIIKSEII